MIKKCDYDAIIIGAGISGLVCGCYLAKSGLRILIVEKSNKAGGCCSSFEKDGFAFDTGVFSFGDCGSNGNLRKIIEELGLNKKLALKRSNPSDVILTPSNRIVIYNDINQLIEEFMHIFPKEANSIKVFFRFLEESSARELFVRLRDMTLMEFLDSYFIDPELKLFFQTILYTFGQTARSASALTAAVVLKEFMLDGGYFPEKGVYDFVNKLVELFKDLGGEIRFSCPAQKIEIENNITKGILLQKNDFISATFVVSNIDATTTFFNLIGENYLDKSFLKKILCMQPSISSFMLFLGLNKKISSFSSRCKHWYLLDRNIDEIVMYSSNNFSTIGGHFLVNCPSFNNHKAAPAGQESVCILVSVPFMNEKFWEINTNRIAERVLGVVSRVIPEIDGNIISKTIATPVTYKKFTSNRDGAAYGWAGIPSQVTKQVLTPKTNVKNLFLTGHWVNMGFGVPRVASAGYNVSRLILES